MSPSVRSEDSTLTVDRRTHPPKLTRPAATTSDGGNLRRGAEVRPLDEYLDVLFGPEPNESLVELRTQVRRGHGMRQEFLAMRDRHLITERISANASEGDAYIGVLPRKRTNPQSGGRDAIERAHVLWADCDDEASVQSLAGFRPLPTMVLRSGSGGVHAYWALWSPVTPDQAEHANRRLAKFLGADERAIDAARILRPPGTFNYKHNPPRQVTVTRSTGEVFTLSEITASLPELRPETRRSPLPPREATSDIERIPPATYFPILTGRHPNRAGKVSCPVPGHDDKTPSCQLYDDHWYCFSCGVGGSIYDLGAAIWNLGTRGEDFKQIVKRLREVFA